MGQKQFTFGVFTKPWGDKTLQELGEFVSGLGLDGIELPVRPGYPVPPEAVETLPKAVQVLAKHDVVIDSIAGPMDEKTIAACGEAGVPIIRICGPGLGEGYLASENQLKGQLDALIPALDRCGVAIGVQNHFGSIIGNAANLLHLLEGYDPRHVCAVWDPGHSSLVGQHPAMEADMLGKHLRMVNLKNPYKFRLNSPAAQCAQWDFHWTAGRHGMSHWPTVAKVLKERDWIGPLCFTAEYSDGECVERLIADDVAFAKGLFGCCSSNTGCG